MESSDDCEVWFDMEKYKYEKIQIKAGEKAYLLSKSSNDSLEGLYIKHFAKQKVTKVGYLSSKNKYKFELEVLKSDGTEYTFKFCDENGNPSGPMIVVMNKTMYIGNYVTSDGFNGIVYCLKQGQNIRLLEYKHGILIDECSYEYTVDVDIAAKLPFDAFFEETEITEREVNTTKEDYTEWVLGNISPHQHTLAVAEKKKKTIIGQYKNKAFNGVAMEKLTQKECLQVLFYKDNKEQYDFHIIYNVEAKGYGIIMKSVKGFISFLYKEKNKKMEFSIIPLDEKHKPITEQKILLPNLINHDTKKTLENVSIKSIGNSDEITAEDRLNKMIGLKKVKNEITKLKALMSKNPDQKFSLNFAFTGNPGTGKTEVARLLAEILYDEGILKNKTLVEVDRSGLVAEYTGQTAIKTHAVVQKALGGVLFIDEAYSLKPTHQSDFGKEAIDALIVDMEKYKGDICIILAGYDDSLRDMINTNKGFKSRINHFIEFDDYTKDELKEVAKLMLEKSRYTIDDDALNAVIDYVELDRYKVDFANARTIRNVLEQTYSCQAVRTLGTNDHNITLDDVNMVYKDDAEESEDKVKAIDKLNNLVGLYNVKKDILKMKALLLKKKASGETLDLNLNMCFYGNPGTGKTEVARLLADILHDEGILPTNNFIETDRSGLVASYVGQTAEKTHQLFKSALNGVLFIDEAYSLANGSDNDFGKEAIDALIMDMENYRGKICVILAGYKKTMESMISLNYGFDSRINRKIDFPDYDLEELLEITKIILRNKKYTITEDAIQEIGRILAYYSQFDNFANARTVRNILESLMEIQALRTDKDGLIESYLIKLEDVIEYENDHNIVFEKKEIEHHSFNLSYKDFVNYAKGHNVRRYVYENDNVIQSSVNIMVKKEGQLVSEGSGFFISPKGIIATCAHVVSEADSINVVVNFTTSTNQIITKDYNAEVIDLNEIDDTAIIGILNPKIEFSFYPLELEKAPYPKPLTEVVMGGYPFGGNRFEEISVTSGRVQSVNIDKMSGSNNYDIYVDLPGFPGNSGAGVLNPKSGRCLGIFSGCAIGRQGDITLTINKAIPVKYLWNLLQYACDDYDEYLEEIEQEKARKNNVDEAYYSRDFIKPKFHSYRSESCLKPVKNQNKSAFEHNINVFDDRKELYSNIHIIKGDITEFVGDAIVNAANKHLYPGGGVSGAIFKKAGFRRLSAACEEIGFCEVGNVVSTDAFDLNAKRIIHAVGPKYEYDRNPERLLNSVYTRCFELCSKEGLNSVAFPSISTGTYRFPLNIAIPIALGQMIKHSNMIGDIYVYCYDEQTYNLYLEYFEKIKNYRR